MSRIDTTLENARVHTMDPGRPHAAAVAIAAGRVVQVGTDDEIARLADRSTRRIDAGGRTLIPGLIDSHTHFQKAALARRMSIDFLELQPGRIDDVLEYVRVAVAERADGSWVRGDALDPRKLGEQRYPTRWELDRVAPNHHVVLLGTGNHAISANSRALEAAGIDGHTPDPPGGRIDRIDDGTPTGVLRELGKLRLDPNRPDSLLPAVTDEQRADAVAAGFAHLHRWGITCIHDIVMDPREIGTYMRLRAEGRLAGRVRFIVRGYEARTSLDDVLGLGLGADFGDEWLRYSGVKLSIDGACAERNAATFEPYPGEPENLGLIRIPQDVLDDLVSRAHGAGVRLAVHAIGPRAVDMALDAYERAFATYGRGDLRHRIEHAYLPPAPRQLERIAAAGLIISTQPSFFWDGDGWTDIWPLDALADVMPLRTMLDRGIHVAGGSDYPCVPIAPMPGLAALTTRRTVDGTELSPDQAIDPVEALAMQTTAAAYAGYDEALLGAIAPGKAADLVLLSGDPLDPADPARGDIQPLLTLLGGQVVYEAGG